MSVTFRSNKPDILIEIMEHVENHPYTEPVIYTLCLEEEARDHLHFLVREGFIDATPLRDGTYGALEIHYIPKKLTFEGRQFLAELRDNQEAKITDRTQGRYLENLLLLDRMRELEEKCGNWSKKDWYP